MHDQTSEVAGQDNVYAPPLARVGELAARTREAPEFYVVAPRKFLLLFFFALGLYQYYWLYQHWARYRAWHRESLWPVPRAIFSIFFMHSLNKKIDDALSRSGARHRWWPMACATGYVVFQIISSIFGRLSARSIGSPLSDIMSLALLIPVGGLLYATQKTANLACGDSAGSGNAHLGFANYTWIILGSLAWALALFGLTLPNEV